MKPNTKAFRIIVSLSKISYDKLNIVSFLKIDLIINSTNCIMFLLFLQDFHYVLNK